MFVSKGQKNKLVGGDALAVGGSWGFRQEGKGKKGNDGGWWCVLVVTGIMVGVTQVQWLLFFFMSIMLRVEDGSFAFWCRRVDSSSFFLFFFFWFSSSILSLFSPLFFHKFTLIYRGWNRDMGSLPSMNLGSWFAWKGSPVIVRKHLLGTANIQGCQSWSGQPI